MHARPDLVFFAQDDTKSTIAQTIATEAGRANISIPPGVPLTEAIPVAINRKTLPTKNTPPAENSMQLVHVSNVQLRNRSQLTSSFNILLSFFQGYFR